MNSGLFIAFLEVILTRLFRCDRFIEHPKMITNYFGCLLNFKDNEKLKNFKQRGQRVRLQHFLFHTARLAVRHKDFSVKKKDRHLNESCIALCSLENFCFCTLNIFEIKSLINFKIFLYGIFMESQSTYLVCPDDRGTIENFLHSLI